MEVEKNNKIKSLIKRSLSGIILLIILFVLLLMGKIFLFVSICVISIIGLYELYHVFNISKTSLGILGYILTVGYYISLYQFKIFGILLFIFLMLIIFLIFYILKYPKYNITNVSLAIFGVIYVGITMSFIYLIREKMGAYGKYLVWLIFISSWGCDIFAYCVGMLFGKHKLAKVLSPKKTIEGSIGGIIASFILGFLYTYLIFFKISKNNLEISSFRVGFACALGAIISQLGDLTASAIKRDYKVKDYGNLIPGHGGILDRFDSVIFTAPIFYVVLYMYR